ncbi:MAG: sugar phosphate nucleotidyltransferase [Anaerolineae bacterium]
MDNYYALILAGGGGTRLWPVSRKNKPKQMLALTDNVTLFQMSVRRLLPLFPPERILIVTGETYVDAMKLDAPEIPAENFIAEPSARDSGPAVALGLAHIHFRNPSAIVAMVTADHHIADEERFRQVLVAAYELASSDKIVTLGIQPSFAATGFGYIQRGTRCGKFNGFEAYKALKFTEKPSQLTAERFVASRQYSWNSGMFIWSVQRGLNEFQWQRPELAHRISLIQEQIGQPDYEATLREQWPQITKISIDYAIMEKAENMMVIPVDIGWSDIGSWASLFDVLEKDGLNNCIRGALAEKYIPLQSNGIMVRSDRLIVAIGVHDLIVIETEDVLMICHRDHTQSVKDVVQELSAGGYSSYL